MILSIRRYLLLLCTIIAIPSIALIAISLSTFSSQFERTQGVFMRLSNLCEISDDLEQAHQALRRAVILRDTPSNASEDYQAYSNKLNAVLQSVQTVATSETDKMEEINFTYNFIAIKNRIAAYQNMAEALVVETDSGVDQLTLMDHLYHLRDAKIAANDIISSLLFQQLSFDSDTFDKASREANTRLLVVAVCSALTFFLIACFGAVIARRVSRPIRALADASIDIRGGNLEFHTKRKSGISEVNALIDAFELMTAQVRQSITQLEEKNLLESRLHQAEKRSLQVENLLHAAQGLVMQSQINPHFLFNTLNATSALARLENASKTRALVQDLSTLVRYAFKKTHTFSTVGEELSIVETYMRIQKTRYDERILFSLDIEPDILAHVVPAMILQPLVENCFIHGLEPKAGSWNISLEAKVSPLKGVTFSVEDNGIGIADTELQFLRAAVAHADNVTFEQTKHGLLNVLSRVKLLAPNSVISIESEEGRGTRISFSIPEVSVPHDVEAGMAERPSAS
jgi:sensor histidine kinase YesM